MTQQAQTIQGSIVAIVTPMFEDGSVDWKGLEKLVEWHIAQGTNSIVAVGTTGEASTLSMKEHTQVIKEIIRVANKRIPIIAGTGANSTREAIELTKEAKELGADAALLVTPYYNKPTQEGLYQHYKAIAEAVDLPQILYNVPGRTGVDIVLQVVLMVNEYPFRLTPFHEVPISQELGLIRKIEFRVNLQLGYLGFLLFQLRLPVLPRKHRSFLWVQRLQSQKYCLLLPTESVDKLLHHHLNRRSSLYQQGLRAVLDHEVHHLWHL